MLSGPQPGVGALGDACRDLLRELDGLPVAASAREALIDLLDHLA